MPDPSDKSAKAAGGVRPIGSRFVRALLNRHDVPVMQHVTTIAGLLGMGYTQVFRRMNGTVAWELEELERVARHFGESLSDLFANVPEREAVSAVLSIDGARIACHFVPGDVVNAPESNSLVAIKVGAQWVVLAASLCGVGPCYKVLHLQVSGDSGLPKSIAILDDDADEAAGLAEHFVGRGCDAQAFTEAETLLGSMRLRRFDAFVIDWVLREGSAAELVAMIRVEDRECPIAILTGKMEEDVRIEMEVAAALSAHRLMFFEKPTRLSVVSSQLLRALAG